MTAELEEIAIGLDLKLRRRSSAQWSVYDPRKQDFLPDGDILTKIAVYEDRVFGWFLDRAPAPGSDSDYIVLQIALSQIEGLWHYYHGKAPPKSEIGAWFKAALEAVVGAGLSRAATDAVWKSMRCGLFHSGFTNGAVFVANGMAEPIETHEKFTLVDPHLLLQRLKAYVASYISDLRDPSKADLRQNFVRVFDEHWGTAKGPHVIAALAARDS